MSTHGERDEWLALYKADPDMADIWGKLGMKNVFIASNNSCYGKWEQLARAYVYRKELTNLHVLQEMHGRKTVGHPGIQRNLVKTWGASTKRVCMVVTQ